MSELDAEEDPVQLLQAKLAYEQSCGPYNLPFRDVEVRSPSAQLWRPCLQPILNTNLSRTSSNFVLVLQCSFAVSAGATASSYGYAQFLPECVVNVGERFGQRRRGFGFRSICHFAVGRRGDHGCSSQVQDHSRLQWSVLFCHCHCRSHHIHHHAHSHVGLHVHAFPPAPHLSLFGNM